MATPDTLFYPTEDHSLDDRAMLIGAVIFGTAQRASEAEALFGRDLASEVASQQAFAAVSAFGQRVTSTEDSLGWYFALREWIPGTPRGSLLYLLNRINPGRKEYDDERAIREIGNLSAEEFRASLHIPSDEELGSVGYPSDFREGLVLSMPAIQEGMLGMARFRAEGNGARVAGYNKAKHFMLGRLVGDDAGFKVELIDAKIRRQGQEDGWELRRVTISPDPGETLRNAKIAFASQAVLNSLLGVIAKTRFGFPYVTPPWVDRAHSEDGWRERPGEAATAPSDS